MNKRSDIKIDSSIVKHTSYLSRLELSESELEHHSRQLISILAYINKLNEVNTENVQPTSHALPTLKNVFRKDILKPSLIPDAALNNAPSKENGFFKVPKVIESFGKSSRPVPQSPERSEGSEAEGRR